MLYLSNVQVFIKLKLMKLLFLGYANDCSSFRNEFILKSKYIMNTLCKAVLFS